MAMSEKDQNLKSGPLQITTEDFYFNNIRPYALEVMVKCRTDKELTRTIEKVLNASDSFCQSGAYTLVSDSFDVLNTAITDPNYFNGAMRTAPEEEKELVRGLAEKISDLKMIIQFDGEKSKPEPKIKDRLNFDPDKTPWGENKDYPMHNMKTLNEPHPKQRIPNKTAYS